MLRIYLLQNWYNLSDEKIEDAIYASLLEGAARPQSALDYGRTEKSLSWNCCRCTGYDKIFKAVMSVADGEVLDDPETAYGYRTTCRPAAVSTNKKLSGDSPRLLRRAARREG